MTSTDRDPRTQQRHEDGARCLAAALDYLRLGWSVSTLCPPDHVGVGKTHAKNCQSPGKAPWGKWEEFQVRRPTEDEIRRKWKDNATLNVGAFTGPVSGFVRVDVEGDHGRQWLSGLFGGEWPVTPEFRSGREDNTGSGLLFAIPSGVTLRTTTKEFAVHDEVRIQARGAQTVLPPSRHKSGKLYEWLPGRSPFEVSLAPMPDWMVKLMRVEPVTPGANNTTTDSDDVDLHELLSALKALPKTYADGRNTWIAVGNILKAIDTGPLMLRQWIKWSRQSDKFKEGECEAVWPTLGTREPGIDPETGRPTTIGVGSLFKWARGAGWTYGPKIKLGTGPSTNGTTHPAADEWKPDDPDQPGDSWEPGADPPDPEADNPLVAGAISSATFATMKFPREWLIENMLVENEPGVVAGPSKTIKTGIAAVDAAVSVAAGRKFLGEFWVPRSRPVYVISAESGAATLQEKFLDVCRSKGLNPAELPLHWYTKVELLSTVEGCDRLERALRRFGVGVVVLDPSYLLLGGDVTTDNAGNMFAMGRLLDAVGTAALRAKATPLVLTHANGRLQTGQVMELQHIAWSGFQQWARQWWLINRRTDYRDDGCHELYFRYGGSAGHTGLLSLDIDEGTREAGRKWEVAAMNNREARKAKEAEAAEEAGREMREDDQAVMAVIDQITDAKEIATVTRIRNGSGVSRSRTDRALERLRMAGLIEQYRPKVPVGNGAERSAEAYRRVGE